MRRVVVLSLATILVLSCTVLPDAFSGFAVRAQDAPELRRLRPEVISAGSRTFTIRLQGRGFKSGANVLFDGVALVSPRISAKGKVLLAEVDTSLIKSPGTHTIQGVNPDGLKSLAMTLAVQAQKADLIIRLDGNAVQEGSGLIFLPTIITDSFTSGTDILFWGRGVTTAAVNGGVTIETPDGLVDDPAAIPVTLRDKDGNLSNTELFFVVPKPPTITELDPNTLEVGTDDVPLIVRGDFKPGAVVVVNDIELATAVGKNGRLEATIPGSLRTAPTRLVVRVQQEGIQSVDSIVPVTPTNGPFIYTIAPVQVRQGQRKLSVDVVGENFGTDSKAFIDGEEVFIRASAKRRLTIAVPDDLPLGRHKVQVVDADGNHTNRVAFEIVPDVIVSTLAGSRKFGFDTGCVAADQARFVRPRRMTFGPDGLLYLTDQQNFAIRTINVNTGLTCTVIGTGLDGYNDSGNSIGSAPTLSFPSGVALDASGTIYVTENGNNVVRRIRRSGSTTTVDTYAGWSTEVTDPARQKRFNATRKGIASYRDGGLLESAFRLPDDILVAPNGTIYVADAGNHAIRRITQSGGNTVVDTLAGNGVPGFADGLALKARFNTPTALALSPDARALYVADTFNDRVRKIDLVTLRVTTVAGGGGGPVLDGPGGEAKLARPIGLAVDSNGVLYVAELTANDFRRIDTAGNVTTLAGGAGLKVKDGPGLTAQFDQPRGLAIDTRKGILYVADYENFVIRQIALR